MPGGKAERKGVVAMKNGMVQKGTGAFCRIGPQAGTMFAWSWHKMPCPLLNHAKKRGEIKIC